MIKKVNDKQRIYIDYTDLNRSCPKDGFSLSRIDQLVDATSRYKLLSFMDAFSGYNQIRMASEDKKNMTFIIETCLYCFKMMLFDLKNTNAIYQDSDIRNVLKYTSQAEQDSLIDLVFYDTIQLVLGLWKNELHTCVWKDSV